MFKYVLLPELTETLENNVSFSELRLCAEHQELRKLAFPSLMARGNLKTGTCSRASVFYCQSVIFLEILFGIFFFDPSIFLKRNLLCRKNTIMTEVKEKGWQKKVVFSVPFLINFSNTKTVALDKESLIFVLHYSPRLTYLLVLYFARHALNEQDDISAKTVSITQILILKLRRWYRSHVRSFGICDLQRQLKLEGYSTMAFNERNNDHTSRFLSLVHIF